MFFFFLSGNFPPQCLTMALQETWWAWQELSPWATEVNKLLKTKTLIFTLLHLMKLCLFCRQCLQHPSVSVVVGHISLQPPHLFCQTHQRHDDKNWEAHWRQWQDLPALFTRLEERECANCSNSRSLVGFIMLTLDLSLYLPNSLSQTCTGWSRWWLLCLEKSLLFFRDPLHKLPTKLSKPRDHPIVSKKKNGYCALKDWKDLVKEPWWSLG